MDQEFSYSWKSSQGERVRVNVEPSPRYRNVCRVTIDPPVYPGGTAHFSSRQQATDSPLAQKLFDLGGIEEVLITQDTVTLTLETMPDWQAYSEKVADAIRGHFESGAPSVSDAYKENLPTSGEIRNRVQNVLDTAINPAVAAHGGHVSLLDVKENNIFLEFGGGCQGCGMVDVTLKHGVERLIRNQVPEVGEILDTTDHASGRNPYFAPAAK